MTETEIDTPEFPTPEFEDTAMTTFKGKFIKKWLNFNWSIELPTDSKAARILNILLEEPSISYREDT